MKKVLILVAGLLVLIGVGGGLFFRASLTDIQYTQLTPDLYMLSNEFGGNIAVLRTGAGAVVVDTLTFTSQGEAIRRIAEELTGEPVSTIINSHYHLDHTHGNPAFAEGTRVIASDRTLHHLQQLDADYFSGDAAALMPAETYAQEETIRIGNKTLRLLQPGRGHTDGDMVVLFVEDRALHTGDLYFNRHYPNIDLEAGGSVAAWGDTLEGLFSLSFDTVIPGHGAPSNASEMRQFQVFIRELAELGRYAASIDGSLVDTQVNGHLSADAGYQPISFGPLFALDRGFVIRRAWEEATGNYALYEGATP